MNGATNDIHKIKQGYNIMRKNDGGWISMIKERGERKQEKERHVEKQSLSYQLRITMPV